MAIPGCIRVVRNAWRIRSCLISNGGTLPSGTKSARARTRRNGDIYSGMAAFHPPNRQRGRFFFCPQTYHDAWQHGKGVSEGTPTCVLQNSKPIHPDLFGGKFCPNRKETYVPTERRLNCVVDNPNFEPKNILKMSIVFHPCR